MRIKIKEFDPSAYLTNDEMVAEYLNAALEDPNPLVKGRGAARAAASVRHRRWR